MTSSKRKIGFETSDGHGSGRNGDLLLKFHDDSLVLDDYDDGLEMKVIKYTSNLVAVITYLHIFFVPKFK